MSSAIVFAIFLVNLDIYIQAFTSLCKHIFFRLMFLFFFNRLPLLVNKLKMPCSICWMRKLILSKLINISFVCLNQNWPYEFWKGSEQKWALFFDGIEIQALILLRICRIITLSKNLSD